MTKEALLEFLCIASEKLGRSIGVKELRQMHGPSLTAYLNAFGSFNGAKRAAGLALSLRGPGNKVLSGKIVCRVCAQHKPDEEFKRHSRMPSGRARICKKCYNTYHKGNKSYGGHRSPGRLSLRFQVLLRDGFRCTYCGATAKDVRLEVDHKIPVSGGGRTTLTNLVTACWDCNRGKSAMIIDFDSAVGNFAEGGG